ncbi:B16.6 kDa subunit of GRIM19, NADH:ubiquinone oxidoreductase [Mycena venus]|uniref:NADH dehydrogenase [ubiquinone] 1 alpha subcomplex subunit 13 n=1 Tax=Mycena venus TaxID=2733690 RepID=A0A8H7CYE1_9AGAR|nr:B16.6 kDa subunit of GRIM19, NADH:ubiquinone oxidoreductase [Mycena venus]
MGFGVDQVSTEWAVAVKRVSFSSICGPLDPADPPHLAQSSYRVPFRELRRETTWARIHLVPLLLAEGDRVAYQEGLRATAVEAEIMKDVKGWVPRQAVYNNPRYRSPEGL